MRRTKLINEARRVVVKVGSAVLFHSTGEIDERCIESLCDDVARLASGGREIVVVSSGAIACGCRRLGWGKRPGTLPKLQAAAAIGQSLLMELYERCLSPRGLHVGQMLLTRDDFADRTRYLNARNTLRALVQAGTVPIVNENDTVAVDEIRFGENDVLSALVTNMFEANLLVMLSTVDGLHEDYRTSGHRGRVIPEVEGVDSKIAALACEERSESGSGGMASKLEAARIVTASGEAALVANGKGENVLARIFAGDKIGTLFYPTRTHMAGRKRWIGFGARSRGEIVVDEGAAAALKKSANGLRTSVLIGVSGDFKTGDVVSIRVKSQEPFARGVVSYGAAEVKKIKGVRTSQVASILGSKPYDEIVHRDNMTLL
ncbi:MAG: glutamate 5-kinase [Planctomycetes bacterium]|nr:glutamate 5-kinase [Planctomycetota bacterium]